MLLPPMKGLESHSTRSPAGKICLTADRAVAASSGRVHSHAASCSFEQKVAKLVPDGPPSSFARVWLLRELRRDGVADTMRSRRSLGEGGRIPPLRQPSLA
jgi:hypothetical protein